MSGVFVAVKGCTISALPPISGGVFTIQTPESKKVKAGGNGIYSGGMTVLVSGTTFGSYAQSAPVTINIQPSMIKKLKVDGNIALGLGDEGTTIDPAKYVQGTTATTSPITIKITDAGQQKVMGA